MQCRNFHFCSQVRRQGSNRFSPVGQLGFFLPFAGLGALGLLSMIRHFLIIHQELTLLTVNIFFLLGFSQSILNGGSGVGFVQNRDGPNTFNINISPSLNITGPEQILRVTDTNTLSNSQNQNANSGSSSSSTNNNNNGWAGFYWNTEKRINIFIKQRYGYFTTYWLVPISLPMWDKM